LQNLQQLSVHESSNSSFSFRPPSRFRVEYVSSNSSLLEHNSKSEDTDIVESNIPTWFPAQPYAASLISNERVTAENHFQDTRLLKLDISKSNIRLAIRHIKC